MPTFRQNDELRQGTYPDTESTVFLTITYPIQGGLLRQRGGAGSPHAQHDALEQVERR
jgi:hypothetical protein